MALHSRLFPKAISFIKANYKPGERVRILELKSGLKIGYVRTAKLVDELLDAEILKDLNVYVLKEITPEEISKGNINWDVLKKY